MKFHEINEKYLILSKIIHIFFSNLSFCFRNAGESDNEDEEGPHSPPAEEMRSRASTPGLSYTAESVSSAFSESGQKPEAAGDYASSQETNDNRSDDGRGQNRSPRPSVLQNTEGKKYFLTFVQPFFKLGELSKQHFRRQQ